MSYRSIATGFIAILASSALLYAGCGGGDSSPTRPEPSTPAPTPTPTPSPPPAPTVSTIEVTPNTAMIEVGGTQRFVASAKASDGSVISGVAFAWTSGNTAVVTHQFRRRRDRGKRWIDYDPGDRKRRFERIDPP